MSSSRNSAAVPAIPPSPFSSTGDETFLPNKPLPSLTLSSKKNKRATGGLKSRYQQTATVSGQDVILIGGQFVENGNNSTLATSYLIANLSTMEINEQTTKITAVTSHGAVVYRDKIALFFGLSSLSPPKFADPVQFLDPTQGFNNVPVPKMSGQIPPPRYGHTVTLVGEKVYIIGGEATDTTGTSPNLITDVSYLDFTANTWTIMPIKQAPPALYGHSTILVNKYLISCFGQDKNQDAHNDCNVFDTTSNSYVTDAKVLGSPPAPRHGATMTTTSDNSDRIIIFGGGDQKNNITFDDIFVLDASKAPDLQWSLYNTTYTGNKSFVPSARSGHSTVAMADSKVLMIWGGVSYTSSGTIPADANLYFFDTSSDTWVDPSAARSLISSTSANSKSKNSSISIILSFIVILVLIVAGFGFFIYWRRRNSRSSSTSSREIHYDPYIRPNGQLHGSNANLTLDTGELKDNPPMYTNESGRPVVMLENAGKGFFEKQQSPSALESQAPFSWNKRPKSTVSVASSQIQMLSDIQAMANTVPLPSTKFHELQATSDPSNQFPTTPLPATLTESKSQRMKKTHRRTSSVSITAADMHRLSASSNGLISAYSPQRPIQKSKHRPRSSLSNVTYSADYSSKENSTIYSQNVSHSSTTPDYSMRQSSISSRHNNRSSTTSSKSVNSLQWIGFNSMMIDDKEETRSSLHVRNALTHHNSDISIEEKYSCNNQTYSKKHRKDDIEPPVDGYIIYGEYVDTGYDGQRRSAPYYCPEKDDNRNGSHNHNNNNNNNSNNNNDDDDDNNEEGNLQRSNVSRKVFGSISMEDEHGPFVTRQEIHLSKDPFISIEEKNVVQKSRPSSKRQSRVSFALQDEKIEFDGTASSNTLSFARGSRSTEASIQEEVEEDSPGEDEFSMQNPKLDLGKPFKFYDEDNADESNSIGSRISRFSFSVYDFSMDVPLPQNATSITSEFAVQEVQNSKQKESHPPSPARTSSPDIRNSIATHLADEGVLWALPDLE